MTDADKRILAFLAGHEMDAFQAPPTTVAAVTGLSKGHVRKRVRKLDDAGLIEHAEAHGHYRLTQLGRDYVNDDLSDDQYRHLVEVGYENGDVDVDEEDG